ncbi:MAG: putative Ig domain-containing protein [Pirellulales bacterium]
MEPLERRLMFDAGTVAPPTGVDLLPASDSGADQTDNRTNFNNSSPDLALQVRVSGVADGAIVRLFAGGTEVGQVIASENDVDIVTDGTTVWPDGRKLVTATQEVDGVVSDASPALKVYIDTSIGYSTFTEATVGSLYSFDAWNFDEGEAGFSYSLSDAPVGMIIDPATGSVHWMPTAERFGRQQFTVVATDVAGNTRTQGVVVDVRGLAPDFSLTDANATSPTYNQEVSPRDFVQQASGWYFTYAT